jgi:hypothetical protein
MENKASPYGLTKEEIQDIEHMLSTPGWSILVRRVYPVVKDGLISQLLDIQKSNDTINIVRGELRALNDFVNAPLVAFRIKK